MNTYFQKQDNQLATYREIGVTREAPIQRGTHEQIDYVITHNRWKNSVRDIFSDAAANIDSDHYPICAKIKVKLKAIRKKEQARAKYIKCSYEENIQLNEALCKAQSENSTDGRTYISNLATIAKNTLPKAQPTARKTTFSKETEDILTRRRQAAQIPSAEEFDRLTQEFRKSKKRDRKNHVISSLSKNLDPRDRWMGIRELKK
jgi:hypothetical protein